MLAALEGCQFVLISPHKHGTANKQRLWFPYGTRKNISQVLRTSMHVIRFTTLDGLSFLLQNLSRVVKTVTGVKTAEPKEPNHITQGMS